MASRAGPRAAGTDGSDFQHRERVAMHYQMRYECDPQVRNQEADLRASRHMAAVGGQDERGTPEALVT
ncbi:protein jagunal homolog 1 isoform 3 [Mus musculus]|uniref:Protein jagunal homolog 1 n=1 Tax=Mus musculus TaxID=10090 RepID=A0A0N4SV89_MOUSE|nr:protein jagunal homolog 1 isoform 3 [Mus musculus]XP_021046576.1 protein jagunal homolog 1 isoform X2 [Mus pahari]|eukprot:NP_001230668.1 protein jagunal homolog 1 isoform 3 [Mus musculus]